MKPPIKGNREFAAVQWTCYLLKSQPGEIFGKATAGDRLLYVGISNNLQKRIAEHNDGKSRSTKGKEWTCIAYARCDTRRDAAMLERWLKCGDSRKKRLDFADAFASEQAADTLKQGEIWHRVRTWQERRSPAVTVPPMPEREQ